MFNQFAQTGKKIWNKVLHFWGKRYLAVFVAGDLPATLRKNIVYVVLDDGEPWYLSLICPCGCKSVLHMNLLPDERPCWGVCDQKDGTVTIEPSIFRGVGCKSHFWVRRGKIEWCPKIDERY